MVPEMGECRRFPLVYIPPDEGYEGFWASPPAPLDFLCGEHVLKYDS
jgi:hypothetical protein